MPATESRRWRDGIAEERICPRCRARFVCGMAAGHEKCWCADLPPLSIDPAVPGCFCPDCLQALSALQPGQASK
ncbi:MAG: cysteine-rich CWC family protein [Rhodocyclaceae bacterium]|nr:cysteine-rich CWC family protein [Rhodocyclaceae bacterium]MDP2108920.1 cysteine-rich CWC family protein [Rhodocyclaceae bacterium]MDP2194489.1 cysteine-rich CWC family protein [Rhodocyclaceae bacterium]MDP3037579.1 cysteine-rich CWC family protein [Rhodocyclaceae bacterium]